MTRRRFCLFTFSRSQRFSFSIGKGNVLILPLGRCCWRPGNFSLGKAQTSFCEAHPHVHLTHSYLLSVCFACWGWVASSSWPSVQSPHLWSLASPSPNGSSEVWEAGQSFSFPMLLLRVCLHLCSEIMDVLKSDLCCVFILDNRSYYYCYPTPSPRHFYLRIRQSNREIW